MNDKDFGGVPVAGTKKWNQGCVAGETGPRDTAK